MSIAIAAIVIESLVFGIFTIIFLGTACLAIIARPTVSATNETGGNTPSSFESWADDDDFKPCKDNTEFSSPTGRPGSRYSIDQHYMQNIFTPSPTKTSTTNKDDDISDCNIPPMSKPRLTLAESTMSCTRRHALAALITLSVLFLLCAAHWILSLKRVYIYDTNPTTRAGTLTSIRIAQIVILVSVVLVNDGYGIFRCFVLWKYRVRPILLPLFLFVGCATLGYTVPCIIAVSGPYPMLKIFTLMLLVLGLTNAVLIPMFAYVGQGSSHSIALVLITGILHTLCLALFLGLVIAESPAAWVLIHSWPSIVGIMFSVRAMSCTLACAASTPRQCHPNDSEMAFREPCVVDQEDLENETKDINGMRPSSYSGGVAPFLDSGNNTDNPGSSLISHKTTIPGREPTSALNPSLHNEITKLCLPPLAILPLSYSRRRDSLQRIATKHNVSLDRVCLADLTRSNSAQRHASESSNTIVATSVGGLESMASPRSMTSCITRVESDEVFLVVDDVGSMYSRTSSTPSVYSVMEGDEAEDEDEDDTEDKEDNEEGIDNVQSFPIDVSTTDFFAGDSTINGHGKASTFRYWLAATDHFNLDVELGLDEGARALQESDS